MGASCVRSRSGSSTGYTGSCDRLICYRVSVELPLICHDCGAAICGRHNTAMARQGPSDYDLVDLRSPLLVDGSVLFRSDGMVNETCKAVKRGWVSLLQDGRVDRRSEAVVTGDLKFTPPFLPDIPEECQVDKRSPLVSFGDVTFDVNGAVNHDCKAVQRRWVRLLPNGSVDRRCSAVRQGDLRFVEEATAKRRYDEWKQGRYK